MNKRFLHQVRYDAIKNRFKDKNRLVMVAGVVVFAAVATVLLFFSHAATPAVSLESELATITSPATTTTDTAASNSSALKFGSATSGPPAQCASGGAFLWANLDLCGWPGPANTGYPTGTSLRATNGRVITTNNTVIDGEVITGNLDIQATNVTIKNSLINYTGSGGGGSGAIKIEADASAIIDHVEVNGKSAVHACVWHQGSSVSITFLKCHDVEDGVFSWFQNAGSPIAGDNLTLEDSYIYNLNAVESNGHWDGYQTEGAQHIVLRHNTFGMNQDASSAISFWNSQQNTDDVLVENNLIKGGGFAAYAEDYSPSEPTNSSPNNAVGGYSMTNVRFLNNKFSNVDSGCVGSFGVWFFRSAWTYQGGPTGGWGANNNTRTGNNIIETGQSLDNGNPTVNGVVCS